MVNPHLQEKKINIEDYVKQLDTLTKNLKIDKFHLVGFSIWIFNSFKFCI